MAGRIFPCVTGRHAVDRNPCGGQLIGERAGQRLDARLGGRRYRENPLEQAIGVGHKRADRDHAAPLRRLQGIERRGDGFEKGARHDSERLFHGCHVDLAEWAAVGMPGIGDNLVKSAEARDRAFDQGPGKTLVAQVPHHHCNVRAGTARLFGNRRQGLFVLACMEQKLDLRAGDPANARRANPAGCTGDKNNPRCAAW